jgi:CubicO group peptidase (beta-lactamase class C family)
MPNRTARLHAATIQVVVGALLLFLPVAAAQAPADPRTNADALGAQRLFSAWLEGQLAYRGLPGIVVGVVADQELVWSAGFGFADTKARAPMTPATKFRMASHSKLFTATAVMQQARPRRSGLEAPILRPPSRSC